MSDVEYVHAACGTQLTFREDGDGRTAYVCERCDVEIGFFQDLGEVDLDAIRDRIPSEPSNEYVVYGEEPG